MLTSTYQRNMYLAPSICWFGLKVKHSEVWAWTQFDSIHITKKGFNFKRMQGHTFVNGLIRDVKGNWLQTDTNPWQVVSVEKKKGLHTKVWGRLHYFKLSVVIFQTAHSSTVGDGMHQDVRSLCSLSVQSDRGKNFFHRHKWCYHYQCSW